MDQPLCKLCGAKHWPRGGHKWPTVSVPITPVSVTPPVDSVTPSVTGPVSVTSCKRCGVEFVARRSTARYCSVGCRVKAYRDERLKRFDDARKLIDEHLARLDQFPIREWPVEWEVEFEDGGELLVR